MIIIDAMPMNEIDGNGKPMNMMLTMLMRQCNVYGTGPQGLDVAMLQLLFHIKFRIRVELAKKCHNFIFIKIKSFECRPMNHLKQLSITVIICKSISSRDAGRRIRIVRINKDVCRNQK